MGVDKTQASQVSRAEAVFRKVGDEYTAPVANENVVYSAAAVNKESYLFSNLVGKGSQLSCRIGSQDLSGSGLSPCEALKAFDLTGFQACRFSLK